jgi:thiosulfate reductase cytochrome b subunit
MNRPSAAGGRYTGRARWPHAVYHRRGARPPRRWYNRQMAESVAVRVSASVPPAAPIVRPRHSALVRVTHWITTLSFLALLVTGVEILLSHPRFYWGETGNVNTTPLFELPIPASRDTVPTSYGYVLPDQNGWSRYLHFQSAWVLVWTGLIYVAFGSLNRHFRRNLFPTRAELSPKRLSSALAQHLRFRSAREEAQSYNALQRLTYLLVIFVLFPLVVWTGLAMSPAIASAIPSAVAILGGQQSARTIHFFVSVFLVIFLLVHVAMVYVAGFRSRVGAMITGRAAAPPKQPPAKRSARAACLTQNEGARAPFRG